MLLLLGQSSVLFVKLLSHVSHELKLLVKGLLSHSRVLIGFFLLKRVCHKLVAVASEVRVDFLP